MFHLNDKVVYPGHGVAIIEEMLEKLVAGRKINFFKLNFIYKDMTILIPIIGSDQAAPIRPLCNEQEVTEAFAELHKKPKKVLDSFDFTPSGWNKRNKEYQIKIQRGNLCDIAFIYRDLMHIAKQKELSFGEKSLLHTIEELIVQEVQIIRSEKRETVIQALRKPFQQHSFASSVEPIRSSPPTVSAL